MRRPNGLVIAIDGPSGAGKSTLASRLAETIGYDRIDTGAMYRAIAWLINQAQIDVNNNDALQALCENAHIRLDRTRDMVHVYANDCDVTDQIRTPEMSLLTSRAATLGPVREAMVRAQREMACNGGFVLEGRDIGTVVFPDAELKFYLSASAEERGRRRYAELTAKGSSVTLEETIQDVIKRDLQDSQRDLSPLRQADDAIAIDSSQIGVDEVLSIMVSRFDSIIKDSGAVL